MFTIPIEYFSVLYQPKIIVVPTIEEVNLMPRQERGEEKDTKKLFISL